MGKRVNGLMLGLDNNFEVKSLPSHGRPWNDHFMVIPSETDIAITIKLQYILLRYVILSYWYLSM